MENEDGTFSLDVEDTASIVVVDADGNRKMIPPKDIQSIDVTTNAAQLIKQKRQEIEARYATEAAGQTSQGVAPAQPSGQPGAASKYGRGEIVIRNADGSESRGILTGNTDAEGRHEYHIEGDIDQMHYATEAELDAMVSSYTPEAPAVRGYAVEDEVSVIGDDGVVATGNVVETGADGVTVEFDRAVGGQRIVRVPAEQLAEMEATVQGESSALPPVEVRDRNGEAVEVGDRVGYEQPDGTYIPGTVTAVNEDGSLNVHYDDGRDVALSPEFDMPNVSKGEYGNSPQPTTANDIDTTIDKARSGDVNAQQKLDSYGIPWKHGRVYRYVSQREVDALQNGETIVHRDPTTGEVMLDHVDVTTSETPSTGADTEYRIVFKSDVDFDKEGGRGKDTQMKNEDLGDGWLKGGYTMNDVERIEKRNPDGTYSPITTNATTEGPQQQPQTATELTDRNGNAIAVGDRIGFERIEGGHIPGTVVGIAPNGNVRVKWDNYDYSGHATGYHSLLPSRDMKYVDKGEFSVLQRIPRNEKGEPVFEAVDSDTAWDAVVEETGGDTAMAQRVADSMVADAEAALNKLEKSKPKGGTTVAEKIAAEKERAAAIGEARQKVGKWKQIAGTAQRREAEAEAARAQQEAEAASVQAEAQEGVAEPTQPEAATPGETAAEGAVAPSEAEQTPGEPASEDTGEQAANGANATINARENTKQKQLFSYFTGSLSELIAKTKEKSQQFIKKIVAPVSSRLRKDLQSRGINISDKYNHVIDNHAIAHTLKKHGGATEKKRGQIPITEADFDKVADIVENYDGISIEKSKRGDNVIVYRKGYSDGTVIFVEEQRTGRNELAMVSMRKMKKTNLTDANSNAATPISDSDGHSDGKDNVSSGESQEPGGENAGNSGKLQEKGGQATLGEEIEAAEAETDTAPTEAQKKAGNYKKGHVRIGSFDVTIENPKGSVRSGEDANGRKWETKMNNTYGYFRGTEGVDGDHIDVFISDNPDSWDGRRVFVVDQYNEDGTFDEHKVMFGFNSQEEAEAAYLSNYDKDWAKNRRIVTTSVSMEEFEKWVASSHRKTKAFAEYKSVKGSPAQKHTETGAERATESQRQAGEAVVAMMQEAGIEVVTDEKKMLEVIKENQPEIWQYLNTPSKDEVLALSQTDAAKLQNIIDNLHKLSENLQGRTEKKGIISDFANAIGAVGKGVSKYATLPSLNGNAVFIRISNHNADATTFGEHGQTNGNISIVFKSKKSKNGFKANDEVSLVEYVYPIEEIAKDGSILSSVARSLADMLKNGEYVDNTGKAIVNTSPSPLQAMTVWHGSPHSFEAFDHSFMGTGEGVQAYGWGTYVTEVNGIARSYAENLSGKGNDYQEFEDWYDTNYRFDDYIDSDISTREHFGISSPVFFEDRYSVGDAEESELAKEAAAYYKEDIDLDNEEEIEDIIDRLFDDMSEYQKEVELDLKEKRRLEYDRKSGVGNLYEVEIPDDNGKNYLHWEKPSSEAAVTKEAILEQAASESGEDKDGTEAEMLPLLKKSLDEARTGEDMYKAVAASLGDRRASGLFASLGYTGISFPAQYQSGGRTDNARNYVVFDEKDLKITGHTQFLRTAEGEVYGFVKDGKVYIDPALMNPNTPIHEYTHLWDKALQKANPELWARGKELMRQLPLWQEVVDDPAYADISHDEDLVASEVHSRLSGAEGARLLEEQAARAKDKGTFEYAKAVSLKERVRQWLNDALSWVRDAFGKWSGKDLEGLTLDEFAKMPVKDLAAGVNPNALHTAETGGAVQMMKTGGKGAAKSDGTYMKAPNGQPTNLSERQWEQVRTKAFKRWFGDWEKAELMRLIESITPIRLDNEKPIPQKEAETIVENLENGVNKHDGRKVTWVKSSIGKILRHKGFDASLLIPKLKEVYDSSVHILSEEEIHKEGHKEHPNFKGYHHYVGKVSLNGKDYYVRFTLQELNTKKEDFVPNQLHSAFVSDIGIYSADTRVNTGNTPATANISTDTDAKLAKFLKEAEYALENSSKVVDENGEPKVVSHSTNAKFTEFIHTQQKDAGWLGKGYYFFADRSLDGAYGENVMEVLNVREPYFISDSEVEELAERNDNEFSSDFSEELMAEGYDAVYFNGNLNQEYCVFYPNQVKSATENNGEFSVDNNDTLFRDSEELEETNGRFNDEMTRRARETASLLGVEVEILDTAEGLTGRRARAKGWFDPKTGRITIVAGNHRSAADIQATLLHEAVAHYGLRKLFGEHFDTFLDNVFANASAEVRRGIMAYAARHNTGFRVATEEYLASLAETTDFERAEKSGWWQRIKDFFTDMLRKAGIDLGTELTDNELRYILWRSYRNLQEPASRQGILGQAADIAKQSGLGVGNYAERRQEATVAADKGADSGEHFRMGDAPDTFKARQQRAVENKGTVMPGLNSAEVKIVEVPRHSYEGSIKEATRQAIAAAKDKYAPKEGEEVVLHYDNHGAEFDYSISGNAIEESLNPKQQAKSENKGVHLALAEHLDEVISESIEVEEHPDYISKDENGNRTTDEVYNDALMHRFYGVVHCDGKNYCVMTLMRENRHASDGNGVHAYEVSKIRVLNDETPSTPDGEGSVASSKEGHYPTAKLLQGVEKSYDKGKKILEESKLADEEVLFRDDETDDVLNDQSIGLRERLTQAAIRLSENHSNDMTLRNDAMRAIGGNLASLRKAMATQKRFDKATVKRVVDLARILMQHKFLSDMKGGEIKRLLSAIKNSVGKNDISASVESIMDIMIDNMLRNGESALHKLLSLFNPAFSEMPFEEFRKMPLSLFMYRYPTESELSELGKPMQRIFDTIEERTEEGKTVLYDIGLHGQPTESQRQAGDAVVAMMQEAGIEVEMVSQEEGQRKATESVGAEFMGSRVEKRRAEIGGHFADAELTDNERAVVEAFADGAKDKAITVGDKRVFLKQGNENRAGVSHSLLRHYGTGSNNYSAEELLLIPEVLANGEKGGNGKKISYKMEKEGIVYTVTTEKSGTGEIFTNFYTNRKPTEGNRSNTDEQHLKSQQSVSETKVAEKPDTGKEKSELLRKPNGTVYGWVENGRIFLTPEGLNPNTPIHEYTHLWDKALQKANPELWARGKELMRQLPLWQEVVDDPAYADISHDEDLVASEVHSRLSGAEGARLLEEQAARAKDKGTFEYAKAVSLKERVRQWLNDALSWVRDAFGKWSGKDLEGLTLDEFAKMPVKDLAAGGNPNALHTAETGGAVQMMKRKGKKNTPVKGDPAQSHDKEASGSFNQFAEGTPKSTIHRQTEGAAKVNQITQSAKNNIKNLLNGNKKVNTNTLNSTFQSLRKILSLKYAGRSSYAVYDTPKGRVAFRLSDHNAFGDNFKRDNADRNVSVYIERDRYDAPKSDVEFREYRCPLEAFEKDKAATVDALLQGVDNLLKTGEFVDETGTFKEVPTDSDTLFRTSEELEETNGRFNGELQRQIDGTLPKGHIYRLGMPGDVLLSAGIPNLPIELVAARLTHKSNQENHPFDLSEVRDLPEAIQNPLAVFRSATHIGSKVILTRLTQGNKNGSAEISGA